MGPVLLIVVLSPGDLDFVWDETGCLRDCADTLSVRWRQVFCRLQQRLHAVYTLSVSLRETAAQHRGLGGLWRATWAGRGRTFSSKVA